MYADQYSGAGKVSVKERLKVAASDRRRPNHGKRLASLSLYKYM